MGPRILIGRPRTNGVDWSILHLPGGLWGGLPILIQSGLIQSGFGGLDMAVVFGGLQ